MNRFAALSAVIAVLTIIGCGGDEAATQTTTSTDVATADLQTCPNTEKNAKGGSPSAYGWGAEVAGIGCLAAGKLIESKLIEAFHENVLAPVDFSSHDTVEQTARKMGAGRFNIGGFVCQYGRFDSEIGGWALRCEGDGNTIAWNFTT